MYGIHNDFLTGTDENEKVGKDVSTPIASFPTSTGYKNIQHLYDNTYKDIWEYKDDFSNINFQDYVGSRCLICGAKDCYKPIKEYYRYAIDLFPFKKEQIPIARCLCRKTGETFSLLPIQLIPYCLYTVDAVVGTLLKVYGFQQIGQKGYYSANLELTPDCLVTPYLIQTWAVLILTGFFRGHHVLHGKFSFPEAKKPDSRKIVATIYLYLKSLSGDATPKSYQVKSAIRYFFNQTGKSLFGRSSCDRLRPP